jgi:hypothetical protein
MVSITRDLLGCVWLYKIGTVYWKREGIPIMIWRWVSRELTESIVAM